MKACRESCKTLFRFSALSSQFSVSRTQLHVCAESYTAVIRLLGLAEWQLKTLGLRTENWKTDLPQQSHDPHWPARAAFELHRRHDDDSPCLRCLIEVSNVFQMVKTASQGVLMHLKIL